jgi:integrase
MNDTQIATATYSGPAVLRPRQVRELLAAPDRRTKLGRRDAALLAVLAGAGLRVSEACTLRIDNVEQAPGGKVRLMVRTAKQRDQERWRTVTLPTPMAKLLRDWLAYAEPRYWLFPGRRGEHLSTRRAEKVATDYLVRIGRPDLHTHSLRHSFGALVTRETKSIFVASKLLGHADPRTTARFYAAFEVSDADAAAEAIEAALTRRGRRST